MTKTKEYKGFPHPEILPDNRIFVIICDQGVFEGFSEEAVLDKWRLKIDHFWWNTAIDAGYKEISDFVLGCPVCGVLVWDPYIHKNLHQSLTD